MSKLNADEMIKKLTALLKAHKEHEDAILKLKQTIIELLALPKIPKRRYSTIESAEKKLAELLIQREMGR